MHDLACQNVCKHVTVIESVLHNDLYNYDYQFLIYFSYAGLMDFVDGQFPSLLPNSQAKNNILVTDNNNGTDSEDIQHGSIDSIQPLCVHDDNFSSFLFWKHSFNSFDSYDLPDII